MVKKVAVKTTPFTNPDDRKVKMPYGLLTKKQKAYAIKRGVRNPTDETLVSINPGGLTKTQREFVLKGVMPKLQKPDNKKNQKGMDSTLLDEQNTISFQFREIGGMTIAFAYGALSTVIGYFSKIKNFNFRSLSMVAIDTEQRFPVSRVGTKINVEPWVAIPYIYGDYNGTLQTAKRLLRQNENRLINVIKRISGSTDFAFLSNLSGLENGLTYTEGSPNLVELTSVRHIQQVISKMVFNDQGFVRGTNKKTRSVFFLTPEIERISFISSRDGSFRMLPDAFNDNRRTLLTVDANTIVKFIPGETMVQPPVLTADYLWHQLQIGGDINWQRDIEVDLDQKVLDLSVTSYTDDGEAITIATLLGGKDRFVAMLFQKIGEHVKLVRYPNISVPKSPETEKLGVVERVDSFGITFRGGVNDDKVMSHVPWDNAPVSLLPLRQPFAHIIETTTMPPTAPIA